MPLDPNKRFEITGIFVFSLNVFLWLLVFLFDLYLVAGSEAV